MDENVSTFCGITGASADVAQGFITLAGDDVERAIELFFENPELASQIGNTGGAAARPQPAAAARVSRAGREDADGVIHIDSDDEDDFMRDIDDDDDDNEAAEQAANRAQEEEDAAMAKRLQEELYGSGSGAGGAGGAGGEDVRAPIARTTETLVAPDMGWGGGVDEESFLSQMRRRRPPPGKLEKTLKGDKERRREDELTRWQAVLEAPFLSAYGTRRTLRASRHRRTAVAERAATCSDWRTCSGRHTT